MQNKIERYLRLAFVFMRHHLREANSGFDPDEPETRKLDFDAPKGWLQDPDFASLPLTVQEQDMFDSHGTGLRPTVTMMAVHEVLHAHCDSIKEGQGWLFLQRTTAAAEACLDGFKGANKLQEQRPPFMYTHMLDMVG